MTQGIRTWKRLSTDPALPVSERVRQTTHDAPIERAILEADFITIPRAIFTDDGECVHNGYNEQYATHLARLLRERFGYSGQMRLSRSGRSFVFEREAAPQGVAYDFGLTRSPASMNGAPMR